MTKKGSIISSTNDPLGNVVITTDKTWKHVEKEHPEMQGRLNDVQDAISGAEQIRETAHSETFNAYALERSSTNDVIRVIVAYETTNMFTGTATGYVSTAFPIDGRPSGVGEVIWTSANTTSTQESESKPVGMESEGE